MKSYSAIRNMVALVLAVACFASIYLGQKSKLKIMAEKVLLLSKRFFGVSSFCSYAMVDGIHKLLSTVKAGLTIGYKPLPKDKFQFSLTYD